MAGHCNHQELIVSVRELAADFARRDIDHRDSVSKYRYAFARLCLRLQYTKHNVIASQVIFTLLTKKKRAFLA